MAPPRKALLDALAVSPHPLEVERQRVAAEDDGPVREFESDDWDHYDDTDDPVVMRFDALGWLRGWWR